MEKPWFVKMYSKGMVFSILLLFYSCHSSPAKNAIMQATKSIKGIVYDQQGRPAADAVVMVTGSTHAMPDIAGSANEKGEFYLDNLVLPGSYTLQINYQGNNTSKAISLGAADSVFTVHL
jgi:Carboxypeptidase regulatory-like domain